MYINAWGWCTGTTQRDGTGRKEGSGWGTRVYLWRIHVDIWQNQYNIVKLLKKKKTKNNNKKKFNKNVILRESFQFLIVQKINFVCVCVTFFNLFKFICIRLE